MGRCEILVEEEEVEMVAPSSDGLPIKRIGRFLKPRGSVADAAGVPPVSSLRDAVSRGVIQWPPKKMVLEGWRYPQPKWREWVEKLRPIYKHLWEKIGIFDAIIASTYEIRRHPSVFFALLLYWCSDTNTFVFPWSEVTITLEDVMVIGGFPVLGESVRMSEPLTGEAAEMLQKMTAERKGFNKLSSKKASHYEWIKHYMEVGRCDLLEHIAFLSLWLSRFVFPAHPGKTVAENVFPIAIRLAQGMQIALGPAVLASLYRDLGMLRDCAFGNGGEDGPAVTAWAPFQILQVWAWERFLALRLDINPHHLWKEEPRVARWHGLDVKLDLSYVITILESAEEFQWRPYTTHLDGWHSPSFYKDDGQWVVIGSNNDDKGVASYARFLRTCELVGIDCIEQYLPHRVAMQFGLDQDLPGFVPRASNSCEHAWQTYKLDAEDIRIYVPPRLFESDCTLNFLNWQQECLSGYTPSGEIVSDPKALYEQGKLGEDYDSSMTKSMKLEEQNGLMHPEELVRDNGFGSPKKELDAKSFPTVAYSEKLLASKSERKLSRKRKLSNIYKGKFRQSEGAIHHFRNMKVKQESDEDHAGELFDIEVRNLAKDNNPKSRPVNTSIINDELDGDHSPSYIRFKRKEKEERIRKELELDAQISKIKAEIAELQAKVMNMEYRSELESFMVSSN